MPNPQANTKKVFTKCFWRTAIVKTIKKAQNKNAIEAAIWGNLSGGLSKWGAWPRRQQSGPKRPFRGSFRKGKGT